MRMRYAGTDYSAVALDLPPGECFLCDRCDMQPLCTELYGERGKECPAIKEGKVWRWNEGSCPKSATSDGAAEPVTVTLVVDYTSDVELCVMSLLAQVLDGRFTLDGKALSAEKQRRVVNWLAKRYGGGDGNTDGHGQARTDTDGERPN